MEGGVAPLQSMSNRNNENCPNSWRLGNWVLGQIKFLVFLLVGPFGDYICLLMFETYIHSFFYSIHPTAAHDMYMRRAINNIPNVISRDVDLKMIWERFLIWPVHLQWSTQCSWVMRRCVSHRHRVWFCISGNNIQNWTCEVGGFLSFRRKEKVRKTVDGGNQQ